MRRPRLLAIRWALARRIAPMPIQAKGMAPVIWNGLTPTNKCLHSHQRWDGIGWECVGCGAVNPGNTSLVGSLTVSGTGWRN